MYGEGEDLDKKAYTERLDRLHSLGQPIVERWKEAERRPAVLEQIGALLNRIRKGVSAFHAGDEHYSHLNAEDVKKLEGQLATKQSWFDEVVGKLNNTPPHCPPPVFVSQLLEESAAFERVANQTLNKPKPAPPVVEHPKSGSPPPPEGGKHDKPEPMNTDDHPDAKGGPHAAHAAGGAKPTQTHNGTANDKMEVE